MGEFSQEEWATINTLLDKTGNHEFYGLPEKRADSVVIASWNIRHFGAFFERANTPKRSAGATAMFHKFCAQCDFIAIQEVKTNISSVLDLLDRLNAHGPDVYAVMFSDMTGKFPKDRGHSERFAYIYNTSKIRLGLIASDMSFDRSAIIKKIDRAFSESLKGRNSDEDDAGYIARMIQSMTKIKAEIFWKSKNFIQFARAPHLVDFIIGSEPHTYRLQCINAHLASGKAKEREMEFFALLEWLLLLSDRVVVDEKKILMLLADLNMDFGSDVSQRQLGIEDYVTSLNGRRNTRAKLNFPFLDGAFFTNARQNKTFDHIAYIADDERWPRARHNEMAGTLGPDGYNLGMFNFVNLFSDAGPGLKTDGTKAYSKYEFDFTDHMPIWLRMALPSAEQATFDV